MQSVNKKSQIEDSTLLKNHSTGDSQESQLTADLPSRRRGTKKGKRGLLLPIIIIISAGIVGFLIPTLGRPSTPANENLNSVSSGQQNNDTSDQASVNTEPEPVYITKEFALVVPNDVGYLNVRSEASTASERLGQLNIGDKLEIIDETEGWYKVHLDEPLNGKTEGWISAEYVEERTEQVLVE